MRKNRFNNRNQQLIHNGELGGYSVNCWGSTVAYHDDNFIPKWLSEKEIDKWLQENTNASIKVKKIRVKIEVENE
jgi:hypothetical protein